MDHPDRFGNFKKNENIDYLKISHLEFKTNLLQKLKEVNNKNKISQNVDEKKVLSQKELSLLLKWEKTQEKSNSSQKSIFFQSSVLNAFNRLEEKVKNFKNIDINVLQKKATEGTLSNEDLSIIVKAKSLMVDLQKDIGIYLDLNSFKESVKGLEQIFQLNNLDDGNIQNNIKKNFFEDVDNNIPNISLTGNRNVDPFVGNLKFENNVDVDIEITKGGIKQKGDTVPAYTNLAEFRNAFLEGKKKDEYSKKISEEYDFIWNRIKSIYGSESIKFRASLKRHSIKIEDEKNAYYFNVKDERLVEYNGKEYPTLLEAFFDALKSAQSKEKNQEKLLKEIEIEIAINKK